MYGGRCTGSVVGDAVGSIHDDGDEAVGEEASGDGVDGAVADGDRDDGDRDVLGSEPVAEDDSSPQPATPTSSMAQATAPTTEASIRCHG